MNINGNTLWPNAQFFLNGNNLKEGNLEEEEEKEKEKEKEENIKEFENIFPSSAQSPLREENNIRPEKNDRNDSFKVNLINKRERRRKKWRDDNTIGRIQVHFLIFLINFCNDALKTEYKHSLYHFFHINYTIRACSRRNFFSKFTKSKIKDILNFEISKKYRTFDKSENKKLLEKIIPSSEWLNHLFEMNYLDLFKSYYNKEKPLNKIYFENKLIVFSPNTKSFYFLLEKYKDKDRRQDIIDIAKRYYLNENDD